ARRSSGAGVWLFLGAIVLIMSVPREVWIGLGVIAAAGVAAYLIRMYESRKPVQHAREPTLAGLTSSAPPSFQAAPRHASSSGASSGTPAEGTRSERPATGRAGGTSDVFYAASVAAEGPATSYAVPKAPPGFGDGRWVPP